MKPFNKFVEQFSVNASRNNQLKQNIQPTQPNYLQSGPLTKTNNMLKKLGPAVTQRNIPTQTLSQNKNGNLEPSELLRVGKYNASPVGLKQWYTNNAYLLPKAAQAFLLAQREYGKQIPINSAYRNLEHQAGLNAKVKAQAGRSKHGFGLALDMQPGTNAYNWFKTNGPRYGWYFAGIQGDPYHFEFRG